MAKWVAQRIDDLRLDEALGSMLVAKGSEGRVLRLFDRYERMGRPEQKAFRDRLRVLICSQRGADAALAGAEADLRSCDAVHDG